MKTFILLTILLVLSVFSVSNAQPNNIYPFSVGAYITGKAGVNAAEAPNGMKNGMLFLDGVDFGAVGYYPLSKVSNTGALLEIGYSSFPFQLKTDETTTDIKMNYITVSPQVYFSGFTIGIDLGFHSSTDTEGTFVSIMDETGEFMLNLKVGGMIPIYIHKSGRLNLLLKGTYAITGTDYWVADEFELHPASLSFGLNYLFNLQ